MVSRVTRRQFKICLVGDGQVGKTSIRRKYLDKVFKSNYIPTLGVDFATKSIEHDGVLTNLVIWDIAGQPLYQSLRKRYYEGASGLILAYSVIKKESFDNASKWLVEAHRFMGKLPPLIIVGNKVDLRDAAPENSTVKPEEGMAFAKKIGEKLGMVSIFIETSALTGKNIDDAFHALTDMMIERLEKTRKPVPQPRIYLPSSTSPTDVTEEFIRETEQIDSPVVNSSSATEVSAEKISEGSTASEVKQVAAPADKKAPKGKSLVDVPVTELGQLRRELKWVENERDSTITDLGNTLLTVHF